MGPVLDKGVPAGPTGFPQRAQLAVRQAIGWSEGQALSVRAGPPGLWHDRAMASTLSAGASTGRLWAAAQSLAVASAVILLGLAWATDGIVLQQSAVAGALVVTVGVLLTVAAGRRLR